MTEMEFNFYKIQTCGNDFILANFLYEQPPDERNLRIIAKKACKSHSGIGANGILFIAKGDEHEIKIQSFTAAGETPGLFNDAAVCAAKFAFDSGFASKDRIGIETVNGVRIVEVIDSAHFRIDLGPPKTLEGDEEIKEQPNKDFNSIVEFEGIRHVLTPLFLHRHAAVMVTNQHSGSLKSVGASAKAAYKDFEVTPIFVRIFSRDQIAMHVKWYRNMPDFSSAGGAAIVSAIVNGFCEQTVIVNCNRDTLFAQWNQSDNHVLVTLSPQYVFSGSYYMED
jgi:diaminopimelate epimerase